MRLHGRDLGHFAEDRLLHLLGDVVRAVERKVAGQLEMEGDLDAFPDLEQDEVVHLSHLRDGHCGRENPLTNVAVRSARLDVNDDVDARQRVAERGFDTIGRGVPLPDRRSRRDTDDDVSEELAPGAPEPETSQLDRRLEGRHRLSRDASGILGRAVHEHVDVPPTEPDGCQNDERGDEERGERVPRGEAERSGNEAGEHRERPGEVAPEVERVRAQRLAVVRPRGPRRNHRPRRVDREDERDRRERPPGRLDLELHDAPRAARSRDLR